MPTEKTRIAVGRHIYALGVMAIAVASLAFRNFDPGQPVPEHFPARIALAYAAGAFMLLAAAALEWRRTAPPAAAALTIYYTLFVVILMNGRLLLTDHAVYVTYENIAMQLAIAVGALISYATSAKLDTAPAECLTHLGRLAFGGADGVDADLRRLGDYELLEEIARGGIVWADGMSAGAFAATVESGRKDAGVVEDHEIAGLQQVGKFAERVVGIAAGDSLQMEHAGTVASSEGSLGDKVLGKMEVEVGNQHGVRL